jgi:capsular polysaccharide biosynthesis protein
VSRDVRGGRHDARRAARVAGALKRRLKKAAGAVTGGVTSPARQPATLRAAAGDAGWIDTGEVAQLLQELDDHLRQRRPPRVAVLRAGGGREWGALIKAVYPGARITTVHVADLDLSAVHSRLAAKGRYDAILSHAEGADDLPILQMAFFHLRAAGALFVELVRTDAEVDPGRQDPGVDPWATVEAVLASRGGGAARPRSEKDRHAMAAAVSRASLGRKHMVLVNRRPVLAKMREDEMDTVLEIRGERAGSVLVTSPAQDFASRCTLHENVEQRDAKMPETYHVPAVSLREYRDVVCRPRQVVVQRNVIVPDSFRYNAAPRLKNYFLVDTGPLFARPRKKHGVVERLEGAYFYLDSEWTGHFGHAMTEQMSRLWALEDARRHAPDLKVVLSRRRHGSGLGEFEREIFGAVGLQESDFVLHHRPVHVERLLAASPMFSMPTHVHPALRELWHDIGGRLAARAPAAAHPRRIFCSRRRARRLCHNLHEVEALFEAHGFAVVYPEEMPFVSQVRMFREAEVIAGFAGSALFTSCFSPTPRRVIVLGPTSYGARNEYMICAVAGHELFYVWSQPDPVEVQASQPRYAGFRFDFEAEGRYLKEVLATL